ncbi:hypothetical protein BDP27DRAFT_1368797 [Rhodocollybia butyracea]|uniref:Uncharacterized protein n=1 Tax=Rhodocollybia butyracea TaxID=206335 RepID=A0A9P5PI22_9AGAR|nr:hypothetical protein BDP27DRAFT_1368797 [Rhodocollybia butyracea]
MAIMEAEDKEDEAYAALLAKINTEIENISFQVFVSQTQSFGTILPPSAFSSTEDHSTSLVLEVEEALANYYILIMQSPNYFVKLPFHDEVQFFKPSLGSCIGHFICLHVQAAIKLDDPNAQLAFWQSRLDSLSMPSTVLGHVARIAVNCLVFGNAKYSEDDTDYSDMPELNFA